MRPVSNFLIMQLSNSRGNKLFTSVPANMKNIPVGRIVFYFTPWYNPIFDS